MGITENTNIPPQLLVKDGLPVARLAYVHVVGVDLRVDADAGIRALWRHERQVQPEVRRGLGLSKADDFKSADGARFLTLGDDLLVEENNEVQSRLQRLRELPHKRGLSQPISEEYVLCSNVQLCSRNSGFLYLKARVKLCQLRVPLLQLSHLRRWEE